MGSLGFLSQIRSRIAAQVKVSNSRWSSQTDKMNCQIIPAIIKSQITNSGFVFDRVAKTGASENAMIGIGTATAAQIDKIFAKLYCPVQSVLMLVMDTYRPIRVSTARGKDERGPA